MHTGEQLKTPTQPLSDHIRAYYDQTWGDYRWLWLNPESLAIHFGYWDAHTRTHTASLLNMNRELAARMRIQPGQHVLDAGCGVGGSAIWLARNCEATVVGITLVASQVERAQRFAAEANLLERIAFAQQDYSATTFPTGHFDAIWAIESICHAPDKPLFLREARRLLKPGGRLGMVEYMRASRPLPLPADDELVRAWLAGWAIPDIATEQEWMRWARAAGFDQVAIADISSNVAPSLQRLYRMSRAFAWGEALLHRMGVRSQTQHGNTRGAVGGYRAFARGLWRECILTATDTTDRMST